MYQMTIGTEKLLSDWIAMIDKRIRPLVKRNGVMVVEEDKNRIWLGIGLQKDERLEENLSRVLYDFYLRDLKEEYLYSNIKQYATNDYLVRVYVKVLSGFNVDEEDRLFKERFTLYSNFSLDGFYRFRFSQIKEKWNDLLVLSYNNIDLIRNVQSLRLLIKHLVACLPKVYDDVYVDYYNNEYKLKFSKDFEIFSKDYDGVVFALIENVPDKITLSKTALSTGVFSRIKELFDVKIV